MWRHLINIIVDSKYITRAWVQMQVADQFHLNNYPFLKMVCIHRVGLIHTYNARLQPLWNGPAKHTL